MRIAKMIAAGVLGEDNVDPQQTGLTMTVTTTGAQTLTLQSITVATGKSIVVDWGDGGTNTYTAGDGVRTHDYAGAGTWSVKLTKRRDITALDLRDTKITGLAISATNPLPESLEYFYLRYIGGYVHNANQSPFPSTLTSLTLYSMTGLTYNANTTPLPSGLTSLTMVGLTGLTYNANTNPLPAGLLSLYLNGLGGLTYNANTDPLPSGLTSLTLVGLTGLTWAINAAQPWPTGATACVVTGCPNITVTAWTDNAIRSIQLENAYSQDTIDIVIDAIYTNRASFTYATPALDLLGGSNATPTGLFQAASPPTTGKEKLYTLANDNLAEGFNKWSVAYP